MVVIIFIVNTDTIQQIFKCVANEYEQNVSLSLCHCAFEDHSQLINDQLTQYIISHSNNFTRENIRIIQFHSPRTAHDCTALLYAISIIQESVAMEIKFDNCGVRENQIKKLIDILANKKGKLQITDLILRGSRLTISGLQALEGAVGGDLFAKLKGLSLSGSLTSDADTNAAWLTAFVDALSAHCPYLTSLFLSNNNLGIPGVSALSGFRNNCDEHSCRLRNMYLCKTNIGDEGLIVLIKDLNDIVLHTLSLMDNNIHAFGVSCLADAICSELQQYGKLYLSDNPLGLEGSIAVGRIISSSHCQLFGVYLSRCKLTKAGINTGSLNTVSSVAERDIGQQLCQMPQSSKILLLDLSGNSFTGEGIHILAAFYYLCPCVGYLYTSDCSITSNDLIWLLDRLAHLKSSSSSPNLCSKLVWWGLSNNQIDDSGASALIDHLPSLFPCLVNMHFLDDNSVSAEMMKKLEDELRRHPEEVSCSVSKYYPMLC